MRKHNSILILLLYNLSVFKSVRHLLLRYLANRNVNIYFWPHARQRRRDEINIGSSGPGLQRHSVSGVARCLSRTMTSDQGPLRVFSPPRPNPRLPLDSYLQASTKMYTPNCHLFSKHWVAQPPITIPSVPTPM